MVDLIFRKDNNIDFEYARNKVINKLENQILAYNSVIFQGEIVIEDDVYDNSIALLATLEPNSPMLRNEYGVKFLRQVGDIAYQEIQSMVTDVIYYYVNPQGLNVTLTYEQGELIAAETFGRSFYKKDVLELMLRVLTNRNESLDEIGKTVIKGTLVLPSDTVEIARQFCTIENQYQGIFSLLAADRDGADLGNLEELLSFFATDIIKEGIPLTNMEDKQLFLESLDFLTPEVHVMKKEGSFDNCISDILYSMERENFEEKYMSDGIRILTDSEDVYIAKIGSWGVSEKTVTIKDIKWVNKGINFVPNIIFENPIEYGENVFTSIELSEPYMLLVLDIVKGKEIKFSYFDTLGLLPMDNKGNIHFG